MHRSSLLLVVSLALLACAPRRTGPSFVPDPGRLPPEGLALARGDTDALLARLTLAEKVGQVIMPWVPGSYAAGDDSSFALVARWVDSLHLGGVIISIGSPLDIAAKLNALQRRSVLPLLVAADLEGGTAIRFNGGTPFPTNMGVAATGREQDAYQMGRITALEGRAVGIHLTFSPVADVNNNPANPIINTRAFGEDPHQVAALVAATVRGLQDHGLLATAKHFPGHGDTGTDSHIALPVITADWARLDSVELVPFRAAVHAGVAAIMSAHIALPGLTGGQLRPATLQPAVLGGVLRDSLHFRGLVVTDALDMGALIREYGPGEAAVLAFTAGADLLLQPADPYAAAGALIQAVVSGRVSPSRLDSSVRRVLEAKQQLGLFAHRTVPLDSIPLRVGARASQRTAEEITARSLVLVKDSLGLVDSLRAGPRPVAVVTYGDENSRGLGTTLVAALRAGGSGVTTFRLWPASGPASFDSARAVLRGAPAALFVTSVRASAWSGTIALPDGLARLIDSTAATRSTGLISFGSPYLLSQTPGVGSYLLAWSATPMAEQAVARALTGLAEISGTLPIGLPPRYQRGHGLQRPLGR